MQEIHIQLVIRGIGKGRSATSIKDKEADGVLVQFEGDPGPAFLSRTAFWEQVNYRAAMQAQVNGHRKEASRA